MGAACLCCGQWEWYWRAAQRPCAPPPRWSSVRPATRASLPPPWAPAPSPTTTSTRRTRSRYNGSLANGDKGRRRSRLPLYKRPKANGVKPDIIHNISTPLVSKALSNKSQHSISYTLSRSHSVIVEYTHDSNTDMFQIGRSTESMIDFVVTDTSAGSQGAAGEGGQSAQSTISRYACRIMCERSPPYTTRIYAAGFDSSKNIFLGERAAKWRTSDGLMDGLTTNGVLVMHPAGEFVSEPAPGVWREISVCGNVFALRETRSAQQRGKLVENESNTLQDGSLIDLCGATLLWRTPVGLSRTPNLKQLESLRQELNAARPQCPVGFNTLAFPSLAQREIVDKKQPWVYVNCGHVHGYHNWGFRKEKAGGGSLAASGERECPMCRRVGPYVPLWLGCEGGLYLDAGPPTHAFCPCGHVCSEKTVRGWSQIPLPHGTHAFHTACPFCGTWLTGEQGHCKLIFQGPLD
ncbi:E3 ubiquitin-protein ligase pellino homolog 1 isoform X4 [Paramormyrops kingsleyae]|uniref:E3 ubiquitin-protein ligase pellino homolog 1 isoform X4 n=1 Tax=Paramormyrops kingsleyae TaxID=1676925 RepID=UPI000CD672D2|nr:E3 ubiquitin-protein ligase pellino homolog 1-like isoform X4 [Paramormyrops kingsleyae]